MAIHLLSATEFVLLHILSIPLMMWSSVRTEASTVWCTPKSRACFILLRIKSFRRSCLISIWLKSSVCKGLTKSEHRQTLFFKKCDRILRGGLSVRLGFRDNRLSGGVSLINFLWREFKTRVTLSDFKYHTLHIPHASFLASWLAKLSISLQHIQTHSPQLAISILHYHSY